MATIKHDHMVVILEKLLAFSVMSCSGLRHISRFDSCGKVDGQEVSPVVDHIAAERLVQSVAVSFVYIARRVIASNNLIVPAVDYLVGIIGESQGLPLDRLFCLFWHGSVTLTTLLTKRRLNVEKEVREKQ